MMTKRDIFALLEKNEQQMKQSLNLVPSESFCSPSSKIPFLLDGYHRYFFNDSNNENSWHFRGAQHLASIETEVAIPLLKEFSKATYVNLRALSGMHALLLILAGLTNEGDSFFCLSPHLGGHYATQANAKRFGLQVTEIVGPNPHTIDLDDLKEKAQKFLPRLVYIDQSHGLFPFNTKEIVETIRAVSPNSLIHIDASHWLGLIFGEALPNPLTEGADSFGGSTHKTFPGPHKAVFATNNAILDQAFRSAQYTMTSNHNFAAVVCLALCLLEFKEYGKQYAANVVKNSKALGASLTKQGLNVIGAASGYSAGHQLWVCTESSGVSAQDASERLYAANLRVNFLTDIPRMEKPGLRLGVAEATYLGLGMDAMEELGALMGAAIRGQNSKSLIDRLVLILQGSIPLYKQYNNFSLNDELSRFSNFA